MPTDVTAAVGVNKIYQEKKKKKKKQKKTEKSVPFIVVEGSWYPFLMTNPTCGDSIFKMIIPNK